MTITELQFFMEKLEQMIYRNENLMIYNHPSILSEIPQIQLLYQELNSMIQTLFLDDENNLQELEQVENLRRRFTDAAEEAQYVTDLFVFAINNNLGNKRLPGRSNHLIPNSLNLEEVIRSITSIKAEFMSMITDDMKIHKSPCINNPEKQAVVTPSYRSSMGKKEFVVGFDRDAEFIRDKLVEHQKQLDVVSIVGMGGLGKTTLATKVFNDPFVVYHFHVRGWVTVSQTFKVSDLLIQILTSMGVQCVGIKLDTISSSYSRPETSIGIKQEPTSGLYSQLRGMLHKSLKFKRYLIVIDDIWSNKAWDDLKLNFPNDNTGSRILLTSRLKEVAWHAKPHGIVHHLPYLTEEESWILLQKKVFHGDDCPDSLIEPGRQIAKNCHGLPLAVVVIAGVLAKRAASKYWWDRIARSVAAFIFSDPNRYIKTLALSFEDLPSHLRDCFLYLGGFPKDYKFRVRKLIWLWIAEGLVIQEAGKRSLEEIAQDYLMELVDRNLLIVTDRKSNGSIKACSLHGLLRELCMEKATKEHFWLKIHESMSHSTWKNRDKPRRIFTNIEFFMRNLFGRLSPRVQSLLCFDTSMSSNINNTKVDFCSYPLLMVLDIHNCSLKYFPRAIKLLIHLRYLAFWCTGRFPSMIFNLLSLQTLIIKFRNPLWLPNTISNLVNLRHLWSTKAIYLPLVETPMSLQTISNVALVEGAESWVKCIPHIKKLTCSTWAYDDHDFQSLTSLETLMCMTEGLERESGRPEYPNGEFQKIYMRLPASLKKLSIVGCCLPWCDMSLIQALPNLEVLNVLDSAFLGHRWETGEGQFRQLKFLKLRNLNVKRWEASSINFPCLKRLILEQCTDLEEIPLELGDIPALGLIEVDKSMCSIVDFLNKIQEEQHNVGNYELKINVR